MKQLILACATFALLTTGGLVAQTSPSPEALLKVAMQREHIDGDGAGALAQYLRIVEQFPKHATALRALLQMAAIHERMGEGDSAVDAYRRIVRDFPNSEGAKLASGRLSALSPRASTRAVGQAGQVPESSRLVWTIPEHAWTVSAVSPDGRSILVGTGDVLLVRDLTAGSERVVVNNSLKEQEVGIRVLGAAFSRDGRQLAYRVAVTTTHGRRFELRVIDLTKPGVPPSQLIAEGDLQPLDWTRDGKSILVRRWKTLPDLTVPMLDKLNPISTWDVGLLSVDDGSVRILTTFAARYKAQFSGALSPDGAQLAVEIPEDGSGARDIALLALSGDKQSRVVEFPGDDALVGWSSDGSRVLFSSTRGQGVPSLWGQRVEAGKPQGSVELVRREGVVEPIGFSSTGALFSYLDNASGYSLKEAEFDFDSGKFVMQPRDVATTFVRSNLAPRWSPDGKWLGYVSARNGRGPDVLVVRDLETTRVREIPLPVTFRNSNFDLWDWTPDNRSIVAVGVNRNATEATGGMALHRIDTFSGESTVLVPRDLGTVQGSPLEWSSDGRTLTYRYPPSPGKNYVRVTRDLATGMEVEIEGGNSRLARTSPDGLRFYEARTMSDGAVVVERNRKTAASRDLLRLYGSAQWQLSRDGASIVATTVDLKTNEDVVVVYTIASGSMRNVLRAGRAQNLAFSLLAPDERSVIVYGRRDGAYPFWWVPLDGRAPRVLNELARIRISGFGHGLELHPDGKRIAFAVANPRTTGDQIFVLENFLPAVKR